MVCVARDGRAQSPALDDEPPYFTRQEQIAWDADVLAAAGAEEDALSLLSHRLSKLRKSDAFPESLANIRNLIDQLEERKQALKRLHVGLDPGAIHSDDEGFMEDIDSTKAQAFCALQLIEPEQTVESRESPSPIADPEDNQAAISDDVSILGPSTYNISLLCL